MFILVIGRIVNPSRQILIDDAVENLSGVELRDWATNSSGPTYYFANVAAVSRDIERC